MQKASATEIAMQGATFKLGGLGSRTPTPQTKATQMPTRRTSKTPQAEETARREILNVTISLIEKYGFTKLSLNDIAHELGKTKGFLYYYFPDKDAIFQAAIELKVQETQTQLQAALLQEKTGLDKIRRYCLLLLETMQTAMPSILKLREDIRTKQPSMLNLLMEMSNSMTRMKIPLLEELVHEGVKDGSLPRHSKTEVHAISCVIAWTMQGFVYDSLMGNLDSDPDESLRVILSLGTQPPPWDTRNVQSQGARSEMPARASKGRKKSS